MFLNGLGHAPTAATGADFAGMTNAQAFLAFASSPTTIAAETGEVDAVLIDIMKLAAGWPTDANIIGQSDAMHALAHGA